MGIHFTDNHARFFDRKPAIAGLLAVQSRRHACNHSSIGVSGVSLKPPVRPADRLGTTLFFAAVLHAMVIFGVSFTASLDAVPKPPALDVVLVQAASKETPEKAERIAQASQLASGSTAFENTPTSLFSGPSLKPVPGMAPISLQATAPVPSIREAEKVLALEDAARQVIAAEDATPNEAEPAPSGAEEIYRRLEIAQLAAELAEEEKRYAERPRIHYLDTLSAKSAVEAAYIKAWVDKVERIGNLNYPGEARRRKLNGSLILSVLLNQEGRVLSIEIASPSGQQLLDDAARRTVQLAAPYASFSGEMRETYDQLMITRTWVFQNNDRLVTE